MLLLYFLETCHWFLSLIPTQSRLSLMISVVQFLTAYCTGLDSAIEKKLSKLYSDAHTLQQAAGTDSSLWQNQSRKLSKSQLEHYSITNVASPAARRCFSSPFPHLTTVEKTAVAPLWLKSTVKLREENSAARRSHNDTDRWKDLVISEMSVLVKTFCPCLMCC